MIERLEQLTMAQFIEMAGGKFSVLCKPHEVVSPKKLATAARNIAMEYRGIADPTGAQSYLRRREEMLKSKIEVTIFSMCRNLVGMKRYDAVREVLTEYGRDAAKLKDGQLDGIVTAKLERAKRAVAEYDADKTESESAETSVGRQFDMQTAALMAYFKFQIDVTTIKATVYANLVARQNRELKAQLAAIRAK